jgi:hypothetical protein
VITVPELKKKAGRKYGEVLRAKLRGENLFPLIIPADKTPAADFASVQRQIGDLIAHSKIQRGHGYRLTFKQRKTRKHGVQSFPTRIDFETESDYLKFIEKSQEAAAICRAAARIKDTLPELTPWLERNPWKLREHLPAWEEILKVLCYFKANPTPNQYIRELSIAVHTKFIEGHKKILSELLEILIPQHVQWEEQEFARRFNLEHIEVFTRIRRLDRDIDRDIFFAGDDIALSLSALQELKSESKQVVITENLVNYLTLPGLKGTLALWGKGFSVNNLKAAAWLREKKIIYWGDIDAHGFAILSQVRGYFPDTRSIMMDERTFTAFRDQVVAGYETGEIAGLNLTAEELRFYTYICRGNWRLEQEKIPQEYVLKEFFKL